MTIDLKECQRASEDQLFGTYLRLDQDKINEQDDKIMLDIFVGKVFAVRTLC